MALKDKNKLSSQNNNNKMLSICRVNPQFNKIRIHKGIPNDTLKIRKQNAKVYHH